MKILLLNPNTSLDMTERMHEAAVSVAAPGTEVMPLTATRGVPYIATRAEAQIGGAITLEMLAEHHIGFDAVIVAAFGDPGLLGARELFDLPVVGMAEAAMLTACMLGRRFALVTFARALGPWFEDCVAMHGLSGRCAGIRMLDTPIREVGAVAEDREDMLVDLACKAVEVDEADVVILAGAPLAGLAGRVAERIPVPVIDPIAAAVKMAEGLVALRPRKASAGTFRRPSAKTTMGLPSALADRIAHRDVD